MSTVLKRETFCYSAFFFQDFVLMKLNPVTVLGTHVKLILVETVVIQFAFPVRIVKPFIVNHISKF